MGKSCGRRRERLMNAAPDRLWTRSFIVLLAITFLAYANISVFFEFYGYLKTCPIDPAWFGILIGVFAASSLVVRPLVSPFFQPGNSRRFLVLGTFMVIGALAAYSLTQSLWGLMAVRIFHGLAFVVMGSALTALMMVHVPPKGSARFFGILAIATLIPNTLVPPLLPFLTRVAGGLPGVLLGFSCLTVLVFFLLPMVPGPGQGDLDRNRSRGLTRSEILENLRDSRIILLLLAMLCMYCGHALVFFFLDGFGNALGIGHAGLFLTLSTASEIGVRLFAGRALDRGRKDRVLAVTLIGLAFGFLLLGSLPVMPRGILPFLFLATGAWVGLGWGVAMPVFNGLMFDISKPGLQSLNANLGMQMFQAGFFIGPFVGSTLAGRVGLPAVFYLSALLSLIGAALMANLRRKS